MCHRLKPFAFLCIIFYAIISFAAESSLPPAGPAAPNRRSQTAGEIRSTPPPPPARPNPSTSKPVLLYSRYFNAQGETRYLPDGTYKQVLTLLSNEFTVRVDNKPLTKDSLTDVKVVLIANPSDKAVGSNPPPPHVSGNDITTLSKWVHDGGGLIVMGNQEDHNLEVADFNKLLKEFGLQMTNLYTDAKLLKLPRTGMLPGLRWAYYTGNLATTIPEHPANPYPLVANDLSQKPAAGTRDQPGALAAYSTPGKGRVIVVTDSGWISNSALSGEGIGNVAFKEHDNWEIFRRMAHWLAKSRKDTRAATPASAQVN